MISNKMSVCQQTSLLEKEKVSSKNKLYLYLLCLYCTRFIDSDIPVGLYVCMCVCERDGSVQ